MRRFTISKDDGGQRADRFLRKAAPDIPASLLQKTFRLRDIKCDGKRIAPEFILEAGQEIWAYFPEARPPAPSPGTGLPQSGGLASPYIAAPPVSAYAAKPAEELAVLYEDDHIMVVRKPWGLPSQGRDEQGEDSLELRFRQYLYGQGIWSPKTGQTFTPSLCHRLDRQTEGLVLCAKSGEALRLVTEKIRLREIRKGYKALVWGVPQPKDGQWRDFLFKDPANSFVTVHKDRSRGAKSASLTYGTEQILTAHYQGRTGAAALLDIELHTGRTHQIRVQCASRNHGIIGDTKYGNARQGKKAPDRFALCAYRLELCFPGDAGILSGLQGRAFTMDADFGVFMG